MKRDFSHIYNIIYDIFKKSEFSGSLGVSKLGLARLLGVSQGKTQHWERGQWPSADDLMNLHDKLGLSYRWLITGEGDPFESEPEAVAQSVTPVAAPLVAAQPAQPVPTELAALQAEVITLRAEIAVMTKDMLAAQKEVIRLQAQLLQTALDSPDFPFQTAAAVPGTGDANGVRGGGN